MSVFDDGSTDGSAAKIAGWAERFRAAGWGWESSRGHPNRGEGHARNRAVRQSRGQYICVMDADDMMAPCRIARQLQAAKRQPDAIIGGGFRREPEDATWHYTAWANGLSQEQLLSQQYREVTMLHPTWFHSRAVFDAVGGYAELADHVDEMRSGATASDTERNRANDSQQQRQLGGRLAKKLAKAQASLDGFASHCASAASVGWDAATRQAKQQQLDKLRQKRDALKAAGEQSTPNDSRVGNGSGRSAPAAESLPPGKIAAVAVDLRFFHAHLDRWSSGHVSRPGRERQGDTGRHIESQRATKEEGVTEGDTEARPSSSVDTAGTQVPLSEDHDCSARVPLYKLGGDPVLIYRHRPGQVCMCACGRAGARVTDLWN